MASPKGAPASHGGLEVIVRRRRRALRAERAAGARIDREPTDQEYGLREYGARDPEGHRWWFSTPLAE